MTDTVKITLRNLPKPLHAALVKDAALNRRSLNAQVLIAIEEYVTWQAVPKRAKGKR